MYYNSLFIHFSSIKLAQSYRITKFCLEMFENLSVLDIPPFITQMLKIQMYNIHIP